MTQPSIRTEQRGNLLLVTLDRPKANAIDCATSLALYQVFADFENNPDLHVAILTAAGERFFSAGWDLKAAAAGEAVDADHGPGGFAGLTEYFSRTKPVIAAVNGLAVGGGFELALACDFIIAARHAKFFLPEGQIGIAPDSGGVFRLVERLPLAIALEVAMAGKQLDAAEAEHWGLVNQVCSCEELLPAALALAARILQTAPLAQRGIKELAAAWQRSAVERAFQVQRSRQLPSYTAMLTSADAEEGIRAFSENREPVWSGR